MAGRPNNPWAQLHNVSRRTRKSGPSATSGWPTTRELSDRRSTSKVSPQKKNCTFPFNPESISNQESVGFNRSSAAKNLAFSAHWNY
jgi:hypothetical protein